MAEADLNPHVVFTLFLYFDYLAIMTGADSVLPIRNKICSSKKTIEGDYVFNMVSK